LEFLFPPRAFVVDQAVEATLMCRVGEAAEATLMCRVD
jgi:hypothetical protein